MAQKVEVTLVDDLDGGPADETVRFALDGTSYEIDLSEKNATQLRSTVAGYVEVARRAGSGQRQARPASAPKPAGDIDPKQVRAWAAENNIAVNPRGRVPHNLVVQFKEAIREAPVAS